MTNDTPIGKVTQKVRFSTKIEPTTLDIVAIDLGESITFLQVHSYKPTGDGLFEVSAYLIRNTQEEYPQQLGDKPVYASDYETLCKAFGVPVGTSLNDIIFFEDYWHEH